MFSNKLNGSATFKLIKHNKICLITAQFVIQTSLVITIFYLQDEVKDAKANLCNLKIFPSLDPHLAKLQVYHFYILYKSVGSKPMLFHRHPLSHGRKMPFLVTLL